MNKRNALIFVIIIGVALIATAIICINTMSKNSKTYLVTFDTDGGSLVQTQTIKKGELVTKPSNPTKDGYTFVDWIKEGNVYDFNEKVKSDFTLKAKWVEAEAPKPKYDVVFNTDGGSKVPSQTITEGFAIVEPKAPVKEGYEFKGWLLNGVPYDITTKVTMNIELKANFVKAGSEEEKPKEVYTVTFNTDGGSNVSSQKVAEGNKVTKPSNPSKAGYTFAGWTLNGNSYNFNTTVTKNITLVATWTKNYTVTFNTDGGSNIAKKEVAKGSKVTKPSNPSKAGYTFTGWTLNGVAYDFNKAVSQDITLVATWYKNNTVTFNTDGGSQVASQSIAKGGKATKPGNPSKAGYTFASWTLNGKAYDFNTVVSQDITLVATWIKNYTVTFNTDGGSSVAKQEITSGSKATKPGNPSKAGYTFTGWTLNGKAYDFNTVVSQDITLVATWVKNYTVTFNTDGGSSVAKQEIASGSKATEPTNPSKAGYTFTGWTLNGKAYDFNAAVNQDITLVATWVKNYTVTFNTDGGNQVASQTVASGNKVNKPSNPSKAGYTFAGWTLNGATYDFNAAVNQDITLVATWKEVTYTVTFNTNGGNSIANQTIKYGGKATKPSDPERAGYTFAGWTLNGTTYNFDSVVNGNITIAANWKAKTYTIRISAVDEYSPARVLTVYEDGQEITVKEIKYSNGTYLCSGTNPNVNKKVVDGVTSFLIVLNDGAQFVANVK